MDTTKALLKSIRSIIKDGERVLDEASFGRNVVFNYTGFTKVRTGAKNILRLLGEASQPWRDIIYKSSYNGSREDEMGEYGAKYDYTILIEIIGALQSLRDAVQHGLIFKIESLVSAETFADLLEQADHLLAGGYFLAAGVLGRAVLEEHLRKWCQHVGCLPTKPKFTMSDLYGALYPKHINKLVLKQIEALAAIGNDAAHNNSALKKEDVDRLLRELRGFLTANPIR